MFIDSKFEVNHYFTDALKNDFHAALHKVDFKKQVEEARNEINGWVADHTEHKINDLMPPGSVDHDTRLVLANAIYFKGNINLFYLCILIWFVFLFLQK